LKLFRRNFFARCEKINGSIRELRKVDQALINILLIDNNRADVELTLDVFDENHFVNRVTVLKDGAEAIDYIFGGKQSSAHYLCGQKVLIFLDHGLPKIDGIEVLKRIRSDKRTASIPVIVFASSPLDQDRIESLHLDVSDYILKPLEFEDFKHAFIKAGYSWPLSNANT